jgi:hypothetical protein
MQSASSAQSPFHKSVHGIEQGFGSLGQKLCGGYYRTWCVVTLARPAIGGERGQDDVQSTREPDAELSSTPSDILAHRNGTTGIPEPANEAGGGAGLSVSYTAKGDGQPELEGSGKVIRASLLERVDESIPDLSRLSLAEY